MINVYTEKKNYVNMIKAHGDKRACCPAFSWRGKWRTNQMKVSKKETQLTASDRLPYEKFLQKGAESLSDAELLAIMLRTGRPAGVSGLSGARAGRAGALPAARFPKRTFGTFQLILQPAAADQGNRRSKSRADLLHF